MNLKQLKSSILQWAVEGKLVKQNLKDESVESLLKKIEKIKEIRIKEGIVKKTKNATISEDKCPYECPKGWKWVKINDIAFVTKLAGFEYTNYIAENLQSSGVPLFKGKNVQNGKVVYKFEAFIAESVSEKLKRSQINRKCLLTPYVGTIGNIAIHDKKGLFHLGSNVGKIEFFNDDDNVNVMEEFALYYLQSPYGIGELTKYKKATAQESISIDAIREVYFPLPPLAEQKRIVAKLEQIMPLAEEYGAAQEQLDKLNRELPETLKKSILQQAIQGKLVPQNPKDEPASVLLAKIRKEKEALVKQGKLKKKDLECNPILEEEIPFDVPSGWIWARFEDLSLDSADGPFGSNLKKEHYTDRKEVRIIQLSNIGENGWKDTNTKYTTFEHLKNISRSEAFPGDIIVAKMMPAGRAIICPDEDKKYVLSSDAVRFDFSENLYKKYIYWAINSSVVKDQVYCEVQGITRVRTSLSKLRTYLIPIPPLAEQKRIVAKLEQLFKVL